MRYVKCRYKGDSKSNAILFKTGIITNTRTYIIHQNEAGHLWIGSLLPHIVTVSLNSNVPSSNESMYPRPLKFCWLFFGPLLHYRFHFLVTRIMFASQTLFNGAEEMQTLFQWRESEICSVVSLLLRETVTMWRSRNVIHRVPA